MSYNVSGSITVKRLRSGATITLYFVTNGNALQQFVNTESGSVYPDWTISENQPEVTPQATVSNGTVSITDGTWYYNGVELDFDNSPGTTGDNWIIDKTERFALNPDNYALRIIANLATKENYAADTLEFTCNCVYEGLEYRMSRSVDINILKSGSTSYEGFISYDTNVLTYDVTNTNLYAQLSDGSALSSGFFTRWYRNFVSDDNYIGSVDTQGGTVATLNVTRDDVNGGDNNDNQTGGTLFICVFYLSESDTAAVATAAVTIADEADEYSMIMAITSDNKTIAGGKTVTVQASIYSLSRQEDITDACTDITWELTALDNDLQPAKTSNERTIDLTYTEEDVPDYDVNVVGSAEFSLIL